METTTETIARLAREGCVDSLHPDREDRSRLRSNLTGRRFRPEELRVCEIVRFEGESDPADGAILYALESEDGRVRGTFVVAYGAGIDAASAELARRLPRRRERN